MICGVCVNFRKNKKYLQRFCPKRWRQNIVTDYRDNIITYFRAIQNGMSTGFIRLCTQTFRLHHCTGMSDAFPPCFWNSYADSFSIIWTVQLLLTTDYTVLILANTMQFLCGKVSDMQLRQTNSVVLSISWRHWPEILRRIPTVTIARTLKLRCAFYNFTVYSEPCDDLIIQVMYKLLSLTKHAGSMSRSECLPLFTAVTFVTIMVLGFGLWLCLSNCNTFFVDKALRSLQFTNRV